MRYNQQQNRYNSDMFTKYLFLRDPVMFLCNNCKPIFLVNRYRVQRIRQFSVGFFLSGSANAPVAVEKQHTTNETRISLLKHKAHLEKKTRLKIKRSPFMKNIFLGQFDKDVLAFPEIHDNKELEALNRMSDQVRKYMIANVDSENIDRTCTFPKSVLDETKKMGLFGSRVPKEYGGLDLTATEHVRIMEACSVDSSLPVLLNSHHSIAAQGFLFHANEDIKSTYLPRLATGQLTAALGFSEQQNINDISQVQTVASKLRSNNQYILSGKKTWVVNAENADIFLILAKVVDPEDKGIAEDKFGVFLVERDFPGVKIHKAEEKLGIRGANISSVEFIETPVPLSNIIGSSENGHEVVLNMLMMNRFHTGAFTSGLAKALVEIATDYCINTSLFLKPIMDYKSAQHAVGNIIRKAYAMESVTYLSAGLFDSTEEPDLNLEYSAVKVYCTEGLWYCVNELLNLMGPAASLSGHPVERVIRDARMWLMLEGPNDHIRQYITLAALNHSKEGIADHVQKLRNPLFFPRYTLKKMWEDYRQEKNFPKLKMDLQGYLHPSFQVGANYLEKSVLKLKRAFEILLQRSGPEIVNEDVNLGRLAELAIEIYVMSAICSRASRAYCIGLPCADTELILAIACCQEGYEKVERLYNDILRGSAATIDTDLTHIAKVAFNRQGYCLVPPFTRTY